MSSIQTNSEDHVILKRLKIDYFRQIRDAVLDFKPEINMIVGQNGTGKSNILSLITSASGIGRSTLSPKYENYFKIDESESFGKYSVKSIFEDVPSQTRFLESLSFKADNDERVAHIVPRLQGIDKISVNGKEQNEIQNDAIKRRNNFFNMKPNGPGRTPGGSAKIPLPTKFISISRIIPRGEVLLEETSVKNVQNSDDFKAWYNAIIPQSISPDENAGYSIDKKIGQLKTELKFISTPASGISAGQDSLSTLISELLEIKDHSQNENYKGAIVGIDEFELSLHPAAQNKLLDLLIDLSKAYKIQFFITTHSVSAIEYFAKKVKRHPNDYSLTYIKDRKQPIIKQNLNYYSIAASMNLDATILPPMSTLYTEDESGLALLNLILDAYRDEKFNLTNFKLIPMKIGKTSLKYLNKEDEHFKKSLIVYDGDAIFAANSENEKNAAKADFILNNKKLTLEHTKVDGENAVALPFGFAPEALIYFWLNYFVNTKSSEVSDFWRSIDENANLERETYLSKFDFNATEATLTNLKKSNNTEILFDFAQKSRLFEFIKKVEVTSYTSPLIEFKKQMDDFVDKFKKAEDYVSARNSAR